MKQTLFLSKITTDLKNSIKDCLLSLFYRKEDLIDFLRECSLTQQDLKGVSSGLTKSAIVDTIFINFKLRQDRGSAQVRSIIESILNWSDFESHFFRTGPLDKKSAQASIENLRKILGEKTKQDETLLRQKEQELVTKQQQMRNKTLEEMNTKFSDLCKIPHEAIKRGYLLEELMIQLFSFF